MVTDIEDREIDQLLDIVYHRSGYDFGQYSRAHVKRRILNRISTLSLSNADELLQKAQTDTNFLLALLQDLSITVTEMFRDPEFYIYLRENVIPILRTYPFIKIWHAGCSTGEEAYTMAIILKEEGLYNRTTIYATDFNQDALDRAKDGIFRNDLIKEYTINYQKSMGRQSFADYYTAGYGMGIMDSSLKKNIVWANHNLVTDSVFAEMHLVLCRNVLIYFNKQLQDKVLRLFDDSLVNGGILCLGTKESLKFSGLDGKYTILSKNQKVFKKQY